MIAIFKKEFISFFSGSVGYLVMGVFLVLSGSFLWVFKGPYNILDFGFAELTPYFLLAPWVLLLLIPAITMKSFAEERKLGTLELLYSKPISFFHIVFGKFLGVFALVCVCLLPTLVYVYSLSELGMETGNLDTGLVIGSYLGLLLLAGVYIALSLFISSLTENQITAFIGSLLCCFLLYFGFQSIAELIPSGFEKLANFGLKAHYESISRGVLDSRDVIYFLSMSAFFLLLCNMQLKRLQR